MISDWTIYGYLGDGEVLCPECFNTSEPDAEQDGWQVNVFRAGDEVWHGLLSIEDTDPAGLSCGQCGAYIFEPIPEYIHEEYGHDEHDDACGLCRIIAEQLSEWAAEHEAREHRDAPILEPVTVRDGWQSTETWAGCPDCEREYAQAPGQTRAELADYAAGILSGGDDA